MLGAGSGSPGRAASALNLEPSLARPRIVVVYTDTVTDHLSLVVHDLYALASRGGTGL